MSFQIKSNRRKFIGNIGLLSIGLPLSSSIQAQSLQSSEPQKHGFAIPPFMESLTPTSCCISIITNSKSLTWIEYGEEETDQQVFQTEHGFRQANTTLFKIPLKDLNPDTLYKYRFISKPILEFKPYSIKYGEEEVSEVYTFKTPPVHQDQCRVAIFNDLHGTVDQYLAPLLAQVPQEELDFTVFNGDIFNHLDHEQQIIDHLLRPAGELFATSTPLLYLRGNHETRGKYAREFLSYFDKPHGKTYQSFLKGPVYWIFLDTGEDKKDTDKEYSGMVDFDSLRLEQRDWLQEVVKTKAFKKAPFRVVVMHITPLHSDNLHGTIQCRKLFVPIFNKHKIDAVICGHRHIHALHPPADSNNFALFIGGGPRKGQKRTIIDLKANNKQLAIKMLSDTGEELHRWQKNKGK